MCEHSPSSLNQGNSLNPAVSVTSGTLAILHWLLALGVREMSAGSEREEAVRIAVIRPAGAYASDPVPNVAMARPNLHTVAHFRLSHGLG